MNPVTRRTLKRAIKVAAGVNEPRFVIPTANGPRIDKRMPARLTPYYRVEPWGQVTYHDWEYPAVGAPRATLTYCVG